MRRSLLVPAALIGLAFPAGLGLAVYAASGSTLAPPPATAQVPTGEIARPSTPPTTTLEDTTSAESTTTDETTTVDDDTDDSSGRGRGRGRGRGGSGSGDD